MLLPLHILPGGLLSEGEAVIICVQATTTVIGSPYAVAVNVIPDVAATTQVIATPAAAVNVRC